MTPASAEPQAYISPEEYLKLERTADDKSEYFGGHMFAMAGASRRHNLITGNLFASLHSQLSGRSCEVYTGDMRVKVNPTGLYTYPDVVVVCGEPEFEDTHIDTLLNPTIIIEVLSQSTQDYDRGSKFAHYRSLQSLQEYLLVAQSTIHVEHFTRQPENRWMLEETDAIQNVIELSAIDCRVSLQEMYTRVEFTT